ncbi:MAG: D-amino-acid transaminase, partial [Kurthia sp.]
NLFTAEQHIDRFYRCADELKIVIPYTKDKMHQMIYELVEENELGTGHVYMQITRGVAPRTHYFPGNNPQATFV